jgi:TonB family protein
VVSGVLPGFGIAVALCGLVDGAWAQSHFQSLADQIETYERALECRDPPKLCQNLRRKAFRAGCYPPIVTWTTPGKEPLEVLARVTVAATGKVQAVQLLQVTAFKELNAAVVDSISKCQLAPIERDGAPVGSEFRMRWTFNEDSTRMVLEP